MPAPQMAGRSQPLVPVPDVVVGLVHEGGAEGVAVARHSQKLREEARQLYLTGEISSISEIARRVRVKPHTVGVWKKEEDWDGLRIKIDKRAAEQLVERLATERVNLNAQHFKLWNAVVARSIALIQAGKVNSDEVRDLERLSAILDRAQKGQRLARGLSLDGQTEEQIRAEAAAETRHLVDVFLDVIKREIADSALRDRIAKAVIDHIPAPDHDSDEEAV